MAEIGEPRPIAAPIFSPDALAARREDEEMQATIDTRSRKRIADRPGDAIVIETGLGPIRVGFGPAGLRSVAFDDTLERRSTRGRSRGPVAAWSDEIRRRAAGEIPRRRIPIDDSVRLALRSEAGDEVFRARIWRLIESIPHGETWSYAQLAREAGAPRAARAVARACAANPLLLVVPCHRVIRSDGTLGGYRGGVARKQALLESEGRFATLFA